MGEDKEDVLLGKRPDLQTHLDNHHIHPYHTLSFIKLHDSNQQGTLQCCTLCKITVSSKINYCIYTLQRETSVQTPAQWQCYSQPDSIILLVCMNYIYNILIWGRNIAYTISILHQGSVRKKAVAGCSDRYKRDVPRNIKLTLQGF